MFDLNNNRLNNILIMEGILSYNYDTFMKYQEINNKMPLSLVQYCSSDLEYKTQKSPDISIFNEQMNTIINTISKGDNPNDIVLKNTIKSYINIINQNNYDEYIDKLKSLNFKTKDDVSYLIMQIILCSIDYPICIKGFNVNEMNKSTIKTIPEIFADVLKYFHTNNIKLDDGTEVNFSIELNNCCRTLFNNLININKSLDENNENFVNNYKGLCSFFGLLYSHDIFGLHIINSCMINIGKSMFVIENDNNKLIKRKQIECTNLHKGYEFLLNHVIPHLDTKINTFIKNYDETKHGDTLNNLTEMMISIIKTNNLILDLNMKFKARDKNNNLVQPIKPYAEKIHNDLGNSLIELNKKLVF